MTLRWSRTILNPPLDPPYRSTVEYEGKVGIGDYPWIPQVINESRMFTKIFDTLVVRSVNKDKTKCIFLPQPTSPPFRPRGGGEGGGDRGRGISDQPPS